MLLGDKNLIITLANKSKCPLEYVEEWLNMDGMPKERKQEKVTPKELSRRATLLDTKKKLELSEALNTIQMFTGKQREELMSYLNMQESDLQNPRILFLKKIILLFNAFLENIGAFKKSLVEEILNNNVKIDLEYLEMFGEIDKKTYASRMKSIQREPDKLYKNKEKKLLNKLHSLVTEFVGSYENLLAQDGNYYNGTEGFLIETQMYPITRFSIKNWEGAGMGTIFRGIEKIILPAMKEPCKVIKKSLTNQKYM